VGDQFAEARLKIDRANKHLSDLHTAVCALPDAYGSTIERDANSGAQSIKYELLGEEGIRQNLALITGDCIHNLKTALDYAWIGAITRACPSASSKFSKFPVWASGTDLKAALEGVEINLASPRLFDLITAEIKPYQGGDDLLWSLHKLDIIDKHALLLPLTHAAWIGNIGVEYPTGDIVEATTGTATGPGPYYVPIFPAYKIKNNGKLSVEVIFNQGLPIDGAEITETLSLFSKLVSNVVQLLECVAAP